jgi:hypothetical protein
LEPLKHQPISSVLTVVRLWSFPCIFEQWCRGGLLFMCIYAHLQQSSTMSRLPELFREENPEGFNKLTDDG